MLYPSLKIVHCEKKNHQGSRRKTLDEAGEKNVFLNQILDKSVTIQHGPQKNLAESSYDKGGWEIHSQAFSKDRFILRIEKILTSPLMEGRI